MELETKKKNDHEVTEGDISCSHLHWGLRKWRKNQSLVMAVVRRMGTFPQNRRGGHLFHTVPGNLIPIQSQAVRIPKLLETSVDTPLLWGITVLVRAIIQAR